jgi:hypothetical protein
VAARTFESEPSVAVAFASLPGGGEPVLALLVGEVEVGDAICSAAFPASGELDLTAESPVCLATSVLETFPTDRSAFGTFTVTLGLGTLTETTGFGTFTVMLGFGTVTLGLGIVTVGITGLGITGLGISAAYDAAGNTCSTVTAAVKPNMKRFIFCTVLSNNGWSQVVFAACVNSAYLTKTQLRD